MGLKSMPLTRKSKLSKQLNKAIGLGSKKWRKAINSLQALTQVPPALEREISEYSSVIQAFYEDGGDIEYIQDDSGFYKVSMAFRGIVWTIVYDPDGNKRRKILDDRTEGDLSPDSISRMVDVMIAHIEMPKRKYALEQILVLTAYLQDNSTKDAVENLVESFDGNDVVALQAASNINVEEMDLEKFLEENLI